MIMKAKRVFRLAFYLCLERFVIINKIKTKKNVKIFIIFYCFFRGIKV